MASVIFTGIDALRMVLETETDANSPDNETTYGAIRKAIETLFLLLIGTGDSGSATSDPPDNTTGVLTDTGAAYDVDEHNGRTLLITSGNARGNIYTIDDTAATTITCSGDNLYSDGIRSGDDYVVLFDVKVNTDGHDHDDVNSKPVVGVAAGAITQSELSTSTVECSQAYGGANHYAVTGAGSYAFWPQVKETGDGGLDVHPASNFSGSTYTTSVYISYAGAGSGSGYAQFRYVTASGEIFWLFILRDKNTKEILCSSASPDHCSFGNGGKPELVPHPFVDVYEVDGKLYFDGMNDGTREVEVICINPDNQELLNIKNATGSGSGNVPDRSLLQVVLEDYDIDDSVRPSYPDASVTVGLPDGYQDLPVGSKVVPVKKRIFQPPKVRTAILKKKVKQIGHGE